MKKIVSLLLTFAMALSLCSISVAAAGQNTIPIDGTRYSATVTPGTTTYTFTLPQTAGVTDVMVEVDSLPESYNIVLRGNGIAPVTHQGSPLEVMFTQTSLKPGQYYIDIIGTDTAEAGSKYAIILDTLTHASNNEAEPTRLTLGQSFSSNIYTGREVDYYTFTLAQPSKVSIVAGYTPPTRSYTMYVSGQNISTITRPTVSDQMKLTDQELEPGQYFIKIDSRSGARMEPFETWYSIKVTATPSGDVNTSGRMQEMFTKYGSTIYYPDIDAGESGSMLQDGSMIFVEYPNGPYQNATYRFHLHQSNPENPLDYTVYLYKGQGSPEAIDCQPTFDANGDCWVDVPITEDVQDMCITIDGTSDQNFTSYWVALEDYIEY